MALGSDSKRSIQIRLLARPMIYSNMHGFGIRFQEIDTDTFAGQARDLQQHARLTCMYGRMHVYNICIYEGCKPIRAKLLNKLSRVSVFRLSILLHVCFYICLHDYLQLPRRHDVLVQLIANSQQQIRSRNHLRGRLHQQLTARQVLVVNADQITPYVAD